MEKFVNNLFLVFSLIMSNIALASPGTDHTHGPEGGATAVIVVVAIVIAGFFIFSKFSKKK